MNERTRDVLLEHLEATRGSLSYLWQMIDAGEVPKGELEWYAHHYGDGEPLEELDALPLEIVWEMGEPFAVVLGTGGPHVEIRGGGRHDGMGYTLHGYWGGEHVTLSGESITRLPRAGRGVGAMIDWDSPDWGGHVHEDGSWVPDRHEGDPS